MTKIKVLIIDDSALIRKLLSALVARQPDMIVVGAAADPLIAREMIRTLEPDVLTLDVEMPRMNGLEFLVRLMRLRPMPVIMVSTLTERGSEFTLRALELGAVDFVYKPRFDVAATLDDYTTTLAEKIRAAATARIRSLPTRPAAIAPMRATIAEMTARRSGFADKLIIIGASTGGTEAIKEILMVLPPDAPGVLITQHMPKGFTRSFAARLDGLCAVRVKEAVHGEQVLAGHAYIAPGDRHLSVTRVASRYVVHLSDEPAVNRHRPSVEVLFLSAARVVGVNAIGIMLTGMGKDGATAMLAMKQAGAQNIAQDEQTCVVFGMPKEAIQAGAVDHVLPLQAIAAKALETAGVVHRRVVTA